MKTLIKLAIFIIALSFTGCWDMYNDIADDLSNEYKYFLAATNNYTTATSSADINTYSLTADGMLVRSFNLSSTTEDYPYCAASHPSGKYLYVTKNNNEEQDDTQSGILMYQVNTDGTLTPLGKTSTGFNPHGIKVHPSGKYVYVAVHNDNTIVMFPVKDDGTLDTVNVSSVGSSGSGPTRIAINSTGDYLFAVNADTPNIAAFSINSSNGTLSLVSSIAGAPTSGIKDVIVHSSGYIYLTSNGGIYLYDWSAHNPFNITYFINQDTLGNNGYLAIHPSGKYFYVVNSTRYYSYQIGNDGTLTYLNTGGSPSDVREIVVHPNGTYLYSANRGGGRIDSFIINTDGTLSNTVYQTINTDLGWACGLAIIRIKSN